MSTPTPSAPLSPKEASSPRQGSESPTFCVPAIESKRHLPRQRSTSRNPRVSRLPPLPGYFPLLSAPTPICGVSSGVMPPARSRLKPLILVRKLDFGMVERSSAGRSPLTASTRDNTSKPEPHRKLPTLKGILPLITRAAFATQAQTRTPDLPSPKSPTAAASSVNRKVPISGRSKVRYTSPGGTPCPARGSPAEKKLLGLAINSPSRSSPLADRRSVASSATLSPSSSIDDAPLLVNTSSVMGEHVSRTPPQEASSASQPSARAVTSPADMLTPSCRDSSMTVSTAPSSSTPDDAQPDSSDQVTFTPGPNDRDPTTATPLQLLKLRTPDLDKGTSTSAQIALELTELRAQRKVSEATSGGSPRGDENGDPEESPPGTLSVVDAFQAESTKEDDSLEASRF